MHKNKALVSLVLGLGIILVGGFVLLVYGLVQRANDPDFKLFVGEDTKPAETSKIPTVSAALKAKLPDNTAISLAKGSWISEIETTGNKIIVHIRNEAKRDLILVLDANSGAVLRRIRFDAQK